MFSILLACLIVVAVIMVAVILLQKSEGGGMSGSQAASMFGGALTGASAGNFFTKLTAWLATIFFVLCAALAFLVSKGENSIGRDSEIREELVKSESAVTELELESEPTPINALTEPAVAPSAAAVPEKTPASAPAPKK